METISPNTVSVGVRSLANYKQGLEMPNTRLGLLQLTGLDLDKDKILEVACIITTPDLHILDEGFHKIVHCEDTDLNSMNEWCTKQHGESGLIDASRRSPNTLSQVETALRDYIVKFTDKKDSLYMAGNTVYMDRMFIKKHMPLVHKMHHYRLVDVSTVKILAQTWYPNVKRPHKILNHRALSDILESIEELRAYRTLIFK